MNEVLQIHRHELQRDNRVNLDYVLRNNCRGEMAGMRAWMIQDPGSMVVVDRGYCDVTGQLEELGITHQMPSYLQAGQKQLTTEEANSSGLITKSRWIVEARNRHLKTIYKFFSGTIPQNSWLQDRAQ